MLINYINWVIDYNLFNYLDSFPLHKLHLLKIFTISLRSRHDSHTSHTCESLQYMCFYIKFGKNRLWSTRVADISPVPGTGDCFHVYLQNQSGSYWFTIIKDFKNLIINISINIMCNFPQCYPKKYF